MYTVFKGIRLGTTGKALAECETWQAAVEEVEKLKECGEWTVDTRILPGPGSNHVHPRLYRK